MLCEKGACGHLCAAVWAAVSSLSSGWVALLCATGETWSWNLRLKECGIWHSFNEVKYLGVLRENADLQDLYVGDQEIINQKAKIWNGADGKGEV